jgi:hypothetical protein
MSDENGDGQGGCGDGGGQPRGPAGGEFLHLEVSRWLESEGRGRADELIHSMLRDAIRARLDERLGDRIRALGATIADEIADDFEANLAIEAQIDARRDAREAAVERAQKTLRAAAAPAKARKR